ncbi:unnamed protein product [Gongylonema pulchrum]|uniref:Uncharacterized protein n=1 Tax=Gongylonema pulchrum TaxID=637853 RepID=A0A183EDH8_9BILA|nr:unnamed protein product [Gongylonema pulchrum]
MGLDGDEAPQVHHFDRLVHGHHATSVASTYRRLLLVIDVLFGERSLCEFSLNEDDAIDENEVPRQQQQQHQQPAEGNSTAQWMRYSRLGAEETKIRLEESQPLMSESVASTSRDDIFLLPLASAPASSSRFSSFFDTIMFRQELLFMRSRGAALQPAKTRIVERLSVCVFGSE